MTRSLFSFPLLFVTLLLSAELAAQEKSKQPALFQDSHFSGEFQTEMQYCLPDSAGDLSEYVRQFLSNSYLDLRYTSRMLDIGLRAEAYENPLPGFEQAYKGAGVPYFYLTLNLKRLQITGGDFYEQFGSGMILRSYYERSLGVDNALRGGRIRLQPMPWLEIKALAGKQRYYWSWSKAYMAGADLGLDIDGIFRRMEESGHRLHLGGSWVSRWAEREDILASPTEKLRLPKAVAAFGSHLHYLYKGYDFQGEYAYKINDPSAENGFIYRPGQALMLKSSYSMPSFGITVGAKHTDNMSFRSDRAATGRMLQLNYLPAFTHQQTYALSGMYPYATQLQGEVAFQAEVFYKFKKKTFLGGKYGTDVRLNFSQIHSLNKEYAPENAAPENAVQGNAVSGNSVSANSASKNFVPKKGTYGYRTHLFAIGDELYYRDLNVEISHRFTKRMTMQFTYLNQSYNQLQIEGHADNGDMVRTNVFVLDITGRLNRKIALRGEAQYLATRQDKGDWIAALLELSVSSQWMFTLTNLYNQGKTHKNYLLGSIAYTTGAHRLQLSGGQQRAGITCVGGICRYVPETKGFSLSYTMNFNL